MITPSGVGVALADGVAGVTLSDGVAVALAVALEGRSPAVLTTEPSGAYSSEPVAPFAPTTTGFNDGGATGAGVGVGAVPKVMLIGATAEAPVKDRIAVWAIVTTYGVFAVR